MNEDDSSLPCQWCYTYGHEECIINPPWFHSRRRYQIKGFCEFCHASIENYDSQDSTGSDYYFSEEYQYNRRLDRANSQSMFIVRQTIVNESKQVFHVMGSTKNVYEVTIAKHISCDCPDFDKRHDHCKHILMILNKGFQVPGDSLACQQLNHSSEFIGRLLRTYNPIPDVIASQDIQDAFARMLRNGVDNRRTYINLDS
ncbi:hypothetical protein BDC45DRAFT_318525 [Circinella umbellata]|nr:hypothetical protein BDC45DRAFT_318525 [Circinella umbellata]